MSGKWGLLALAIVSEVTATLALRAATDGSAAWYLLVVAGYLFAFVVMARILAAGVAVGVVYGIWAASGVALTAVLATVLFGESLTPTMGLGIVVVIAGVLLVETGSHDASATTGSGAR